VVAKRVFNFRLDEAVVRFLDELAARAGFTRSDAVRQSAQAAAGILEAARRQSISRLALLRERYGDEGQLIAVVSQGENGTPLGHVVIDGEEITEGVRAVPILTPNGKASLVFLNISGAWNVNESVLARFGDEYVYIPEARFPLGELPWPPDPRKGIVMRLGDIDKIVEADPMLAEEPVEA